MLKKPDVVLIPYLGKPFVACFQCVVVVKFIQSYGREDEQEWFFQTENRTIIEFVLKKLQEEEDGLVYHVDHG